MILIFPTPEALRFALAAAIVPPEAATAPVRASRDADGRTFVESDAKLSKGAKEQLEALHVLGSRKHLAPVEEAGSWLELVPTVRHDRTPEVSAQTVVVFELDDPAGLPALVGELLRLGNDRQAFRFVGDPAAAQLRVIGPPYYTLLAAGESVGRFRAYREVAPRVWVELGATHPFAGRVVSPAGTEVFLRAGLPWRRLPESPYRDVYAASEFALPPASPPLVATEPTARFVVPLRLRPAPTTEPAELWVLRGDGLGWLDGHVGTLSDADLEQLRFAVATDTDGSALVVLRVAPNRREPLYLEFAGAAGYRPYWKLPNLYLPLGTRLHPQLRRDVVRGLLADDADTLVVLDPTAEGRFRPTAIAQSAFRPLSAWVEYVLETNRAALAEWVAASTFEFSAFVCGEGVAAKAKAPPAAKDAKPAKPVAPAAAPRPREAGPTVPFVAPAVEATPVVRVPSAWKVRRDELERQFLDAGGPLDQPARLALWPAIAEANAHLGSAGRDDAALGWLNVLWHGESAAGVVDAWFATEFPDGAALTDAAWSARTADANPTLAELRGTAVLLLKLLAEPTPWLAARLPAARQYFERHDRLLPVRAAWLLAVLLARHAGGDVLGLARVRDRILARLLEEGLSAERDLPGFLRFAGHNDSERVRLVREQAEGVLNAVRGFTERSLQAGVSGPTRNPPGPTLGYLELMFAYGFARLGEPATANSLRASAEKRLVVPKPPESAEKEGIAPYARYLAGGWLARAFGDRVEQALAGAPPSAPFGVETQRSLEAIRGGVPGPGAAVNTNPYGMADYVITRMREQSRILEPQERVAPYAVWMGQGDELKRGVAELETLREPALLQRRVAELAREAAGAKGSPESRMLVLHAALPLAARVGEPFAATLIQQVPGVLEGAGGAAAGPELPKYLGQVLERALFVAAHYDRTDLVQQLVDQFIRAVARRPEDERYELVNVVAGQCLRSLRKLGLRDQIDTLLRRMQTEVLKGESVAALKSRYGGKPDLWADALMTLVNLAGGWLTFGLTEQAVATLDAARAEILAPVGKMGVQRFTKLVQTYVSALGQGPGDMGLPRLVELFDKLNPARVTNTFTSAPYYSRLHLNLVEEVVLALVSDDFGLGEAGRKWLDEDEAIVRRRIHADMRQALGRSGLTP